MVLRARTISSSNDPHFVFVPVGWRLGFIFNDTKAAVVAGISGFDPAVQPTAWPAMLPRKIERANLSHSA
jgi:hypothetical protein